MLSPDHVGLLHVSCSWFVLGVVTLVGWHIYPAFQHFAALDGPSWTAHHERHMNLMGVIVGIPMVIQLLTAIWWLAIATNTALGINLVLVIITWVITFVWAVPAHNALTNGFDAATHASLVRINHIRWIVWIVQTILVTVMIWPSRGP